MFVSISELLPNPFPEGEAACQVLEQASGEGECFPLKRGFCECRESSVVERII